MPRGKELEQLPMGNTLPGAGKDMSKFDRDIATGITSDERPRPARISAEDKNK